MSTTLKGLIKKNIYNNAALYKSRSDNECYLLDMYSEQVFPEVFVITIL